MSKSAKITLLTIAFAILLPLTTDGIAGEGKDKVDICHITGTYDFGDPGLNEDIIQIGHLITIAEPALKAHIKNGDFEKWQVVTLPDDSEKEVCLRSIEICHFEEKTHEFQYGDALIGDVINIPESAYRDYIKDGDLSFWNVVILPDGQEACFGSTDVCEFDGDTYDFEDDEEGHISIGKVIKIHESNYQNFLNQGHPEIWRDATLADGTEVCLESELEEGQFENGVALFGHDVGSGKHFTIDLTPKRGQALAVAWYGGHHYESMTPIYIDGKQYVMGHSSQKGSNGYYHWFIQRILPSGDFGQITHTGYFGHYYKTLIAVTKPDGRVFISGQRDYDDNYVFTMEVLPGGKLEGTTLWSKNRSRFYDAVTPLIPNTHHTCFYIHNSHDDNNWYTECINPDDVSDVRIHDSGTFGHGYQVALTYRSGGKSYLFGHRHRLSGLHYYGPWFIKSMSDFLNLGGFTDSGEFHNYYKTMTAFTHPTGRAYLIGHNTHKDWFIKHVSHYGNMDETIDSGHNMAHYYEHFFPIAYDKETYYSVDTWMGHLLTEMPDFGDRKLSEIALPGSHDAGMNYYDINWKAPYCFGGNKCNTATQVHDIKGQLELGSRYFDIRVMINEGLAGGDWHVGHASEEAGSTLGCLGESKSDILNDLTDFFEEKNSDGTLKHAKELVILKFSHCMATPGPFTNTCTSTQLTEMADNVVSHLSDYLVTCDPEEEDNCLHDMTLDEILDKGNIILVVEGARDTANGIFQWGYGSDGDYYVYDEYSNSNTFDTMEHDQKSKLLTSDNHTGHYGGFLLSWTLTLDTKQAVTCDLDPGDATSILYLAKKTQPRLFEFIYQWVEKNELTKALFPNLLYVDDFGRTATSAAIYLNKKWNNLPSSWETLPEYGHDIGVGADGSVYKVGNTRVTGGFEIKNWAEADQVWALLGTRGGDSIDVDSYGIPWITDEYNQEIFYWAQYAGGGYYWKQVPGYAYDIAAGGEGSVWKVGTIQVDGGREISKWNGTSWDVMGNRGGVRIDVESSGIYAWMVDDIGDIYFWDGTEWLLISNHNEVLGSAIGVGADDSIWMLGGDFNEDEGGWEIWKMYKSDTAWQWVKKDGRGVNISVDQNGLPWVVNAQQEILRQQL